MSRETRHAFTLIELLVVIVIIAILASFAYPVYIGVQERARVTQDLNNLRQLGLATQRYLSDNDEAFFAAGSTWMSQLHPKYLPAWNIFQSAFDRRGESELGDGTTPVSYGINSNITDKMDSSKITNPSIFIVFAPAQASGATVNFQGTPLTAAPGVKVLKNATTPNGPATGGTHNQRKRINALSADLHAETLLWKVFANSPNGSDTLTTQRWSP